MENVAENGIRVLDCALSVNEMRGLQAIPEDRCTMRERLPLLQHEKGEPVTCLLRVNLQAGPVALTKGVFSNCALGLYHWLSAAPMGMILQLSAQTLTALFAMMQRAQGPRRQYVSVYNVPDADREKEAGKREIWSDPVKVKQWEERLNADTHISFPGVQFCGLFGLLSYSACGSARDVEKTIPDSPQPTIFVTQDTFFCAWYGLSAARHRSDMPRVSASVAGSALEDPRGGQWFGCSGFWGYIMVESRTATAAVREQGKVGMKALRLEQTAARAWGKQQGSDCMPTTWRVTIFLKSRCNWGGLQ